jgi:hypothetical protein
MSVIPTKCACEHAGSCPFCKMIAWGLQAEVSQRDPRTRVPDADDVGSFASKGRSNSARAKRKARHTRIVKERERYAAAKAARVARALALGISSKWGELSPEQVQSAAAQCDAAHRHAPMTDTLRRHLEGYLRRNEGLALIVVDAPKAYDDTADDGYRDKIARPAYLTRSAPWTGRDD